MCARVTSTYMEFTFTFGAKSEFKFSFKYLFLLLAYFIPNAEQSQCFQNICSHLFYIIRFLIL